MHGLRTGAVLVEIGESNAMATDTEVVAEAKAARKALQIVEEHLGDIDAQVSMLRKRARDLRRVRQLLDARLQELNPDLPW